MLYYVNMKYFMVVGVAISSPAQLDELAAINGVGQVDADRFATPVVDDIAREDPTWSADVYEPPEAVVDMDVIKEVIGANGPVASAYDGSGVTVGHVDTGADFGPVSTR